MEVSVFPASPLGVILLLDRPNFVKGSIFLFDDRQVCILGRLNLEDFETKLHPVFTFAQRLALSTEASDALEGFLVVLELELLCDGKGSTLLESFTVVGDVFLEIVNGLLHLRLEVLKASPDDVLGFAHAELESFPGRIDVSQVCLVLLSQFKRASSNVTVVVIHDELELFLDGIDFALEFTPAVVDLRQLILILLELLLRVTWLGQLCHGIRQLSEEFFQLFLAFLDQVAKDLCDRRMALLHQLLL